MNEVFIVADSFRKRGDHPQYNAVVTFSLEVWRTLQRAGEDFSLRSTEQARKVPAGTLKRAPQKR